MILLHRLTLTKIIKSIKYFIGRIENFIPKIGGFNRKSR